MKTLIFLIICFNFIIYTSAQEPEIEWYKVLDFQIDIVGNSIHEKNDGGYIIGGRAGGWAGGPHRCLVISTDNKGDTLWTKVYGPEDVFATCMQKTIDNGYIFAGDISETLHSSIYILKLDSNFAFEWNKVLGDSTRIHHDIWLEQTSDSGYILTGESNSDTNYAFFTLKISNNGDIQWSKTFEWGSEPSCVKQTEDDRYVITGLYHPINLSNKEFLLKLNSEGDSVWTKTYTNDSTWARFKDVLITSDGGFLIIGSKIYPSINESNLFLIKTDFDGDTIWTKEYSNSGGSAVIESIDGNYIIGGIETGPGFRANNFIMAINTNGDSLWSVGWAADTSSFYSIKKGALRQTSDGGYIVMSNQSGGYTFYDIELTKFSAEPINIQNNLPNIPYITTLSHNYPNPFNPFTTIQYSIKERSSVELILYDILGREVEVLVNQEQDVGQYKINLIANGLASGVYFYRLQAGSFVETKKMILMK
jgi:hypothetical protein